MWPETIEAVRDSISRRPISKEPGSDRLVFLTRYGLSWTKETSTNPISQEFRKLLNRLNLYRPGLGFYALRHTFETIGGDSRDQVAVSHIMGHTPHAGDMSARYRERIDDQRLVDVVAHVHRWLFKDATDG